MTFSAAAVALVLLAAPLWLVWRLWRRFGWGIALAWAAAIYIVPLGLGSAVLNLTTHNPIGDSIMVTLAASLAMLAGAALFLRFGKPRRGSVP